MSYRPIRPDEDDAVDTGTEEASDAGSLALSLRAADDNMMKAHEEYLKALSAGSEEMTAVAGALHALHVKLFEREERFMRDRAKENLLHDLKEGRKALLEGLKAAEQDNKEEE